MKYEAKCQESATGVCGNPGTYLPVSQAAHTPWASINWTNAKNRCQAVDASLITNAQWMTMARNIEAQPTNWSTNTVGSGHLYRGHTDNVPANALAASTNDNDGYYLTGNTSPSEQRRTLILSNNETLWDFSGNVWQWVDEITATFAEQPNTSPPASETWLQFNALTTYGKYKYDQIAPSNTSWFSDHGVGRYYPRNLTNRVWRRGGNWSSGSDAGVFTLLLSNSATDTYTPFGFRYAR